MNAPTLTSSAQRSHNPGLKVFLSTIVVLMSAIFFFNLHMDIAGFGAGEIAPLASAQKVDEWLVSDRDYDQRVWVRTKLNAQCPEVMVLGSSTIGTLDPAQLLTQNASPAGRAFNLWLTGPSVEDFEAMAQLLSDTRCTPQRIVMGIDPFLLNEQVTSDRWQSVKDLQRAFETRGQNSSSGAGQWLWGTWSDVRLRWLKFTDLLAYQTTVSGIERLRSSGAAKMGPRLLSDLGTYCKNTPEIQSVRHFDGHFIYCDEWIKPQEKVDSLARTYVERNLHGMQKWRVVSRERLVRLEASLARMKAPNVRLTLLAPTYHPLTFAAISGAQPLGKVLQSFDDEVERMSKRLGAEWVLLRDPQVAGCSADEFFDSHHPNLACGKKIAQKIR